MHFVVSVSLYHLNFVLNCIAVLRKLRRHQAVLVTLHQAGTNQTQQWLRVGHGRVMVQGPGLLLVGGRTTCHLRHCHTGTRTNQPVAKAAVPGTAWHGLLQWWWRGCFMTAIALPSWSARVLCGCDKCATWQQNVHIGADLLALALEKWIFSIWLNFTCNPWHLQLASDQVAWFSCWDETKLHLSSLAWVHWEKMKNNVCFCKKQQINWNFFWCSQCIVWCKSLGKWYWLFYWNIICS